jgi:hypothetical protein
MHCLRRGCSPYFHYHFLSGALSSALAHAHHVPQVHLFLPSKGIASPISCQRKRLPFTIQRRYRRISCQSPCSTCSACSAGAFCHTVPFLPSHIPFCHPILLQRCSSPLMPKVLCGRCNPLSCSMPSSSLRNLNTWQLQSA